MAKARLLTEAFLHAVKATDKEMEYSDSKVPGLRYAVQPSNARSWVYRFRMHGKSAQHTIGRHPPIGLRDARGMAQEAAVDVAKGVDPRARKLAAKAAAKEAAAPKLDGIENVVTAYIERYAKKQTRERSCRDCRPGGAGRRQQGLERAPQIMQLGARRGAYRGEPMHGRARALERNAPRTDARRRRAPGSLGGDRGTWRSARTARSHASLDRLSRSRSL